MQLFYNSELTATSQQFTFDKTESRHIVRVLRKKENDKIFITNGKGKLFTSEILIANDKKCLVKIITTEAFKKPWNYYLHIAIAPTKLNDRFEWFLEKATEIGIDEITPIICEHSERKVVKPERLEKIIQSAAKQSLKYHFPKLNEPVTFNQFINSNFDGQLFIAHCEETAKKSLKTALKPKLDTTILIGPEGDFSIKEIMQSLVHNFIPVSLGESRLRTETAGIVAVHSVAFTNE
ncbi:MAG: 16S rRNA (uracil(1498)-N(3))-methyltransferase [Lutibacter sp.]|uniref:16S rRNA (uracil(1498)-N(3))-methyltransferase n=1 Tax=Lutibacter sp. TaxID=1925666 RepID=UPI0018226130|nr:16S rRNA (uracil(1498)-N(3))-methyltransferase [Lutibacter sp.]MBT8317515.1 16S rRNA (uracil(1498)-N(3))-methyltransferase [Lutibacter sp.]NNJ58374.1 16S rRNA (uracil(1498)-N(3))-methyltransferase [Lutibacter sp.]